MRCFLFFEKREGNSEIEHYFRQRVEPGGTWWNVVEHHALSGGIGNDFHFSQHVFEQREHLLNFHLRNTNDVGNSEIRWKGGFLVLAQKPHDAGQTAGWQAEKPHKKVPPSSSDFQPWIAIP